MENKSKGNLIISIIVLVLCAILGFGTRFIFHACGPKEDGGYMLCHWVQQSVFALGIVMTVQSIIMAVFKNTSAQIISSLIMIPEAVLAMLFPNVIIPMCMMPDMRCHAVMRPFVLCISAVIIILLIINCVIGIKGRQTNAQ